MAQGFCRQGISRYHLVTFGCQMNKYDSERLEGILATCGMEQTENPAEADLILVNSCSIREKAENKVFSLIGRFAKQKGKKKDLIIGLGGCMATLHREDIFRRAPALDLVFGPDSLEKLPGMIDEFLATGRRQMDVGFSDTTTWDGPEFFVRPSSVTAWVGIMKGCNNNCSYCVVPRARGPEVSRPFVSILNEVEYLAEKGFKEVNLLGQNVNSYGKTLSPKLSFPKLLEKLEKVDGIERIRFMTSHPKDLTDELIDVMAFSRKICPSLHLPLQAGSDRILQMMSRGYTAGEYLEKVNRLKSAVEGITVSTDLMVGFPTETEEDFERTYRVMEEIRFDSLYLFIYSKRSKTRAAFFDGQVPREVAKRRFDRAYSLHKKIVSEKNRELIGRKVEVLCEGAYNGNLRERSKCGYAQFGRTGGNHGVIFEESGDLTGKTFPVTIIGNAGFDLRGKTASERNCNE